ncbi:Putative ppx/GppA phosphatase, ATPase, nucleotide binding domain-containing protein [Septoria linicola]|uniref:Ppx/GppA phosphatase, ATPase, nucleotide binding domain-containing protein n=1 Tax=Septoria linicola TaxID=215465 RepID=A0A9Q9EP80_9PEZI|nr:putative ppx/GppA phosphatase, ATPase, nucleotide binding domain-containing protein [Septoria linicola]USW56253.1 Putative ppx/GppA phosphatase, ATPase, nucleotide binding domain-containing protein [Septoria linicola]
MTVEPARHGAEHLHGIVDMGSNGIRFSISSLHPPTQRVMPTLYQHRVGISLYDAQYSQTGERVPIDDKTIKAVTKAFKQFKRTCQDFGVPEQNTTVLATEATRTAINSEPFRSEIKKEVGWDVTMLAKEDEGKVGAMGVASSLPALTGLVMDLGGGSTQLSWIVKNSASDGVQLPPSGAVSMPYGAAAMSRRLADAERDGSTADLRKEVREAFKTAYASLKVPEELATAARQQGGFTLYLSGGGFRGWGYVLMSQHHVQPYPIPVINGFKVDRSAFLSTDQVKAAAAESLEHAGEGDLFRISDRRAGQVPAVAFLVNVLAEALPLVKEVRFCQGGVREGHLFSALPTEIKAELPLVVATRPFTKPSASAALVHLLEAALPPGSTSGAIDDYKIVFVPDLLEAFANLIYYHSSHSKDLQSSAALRSTTAGVLAGVHGITHEARILIALLLCARWGGSTPPSDDVFKRSLEQLVGSPWTLWWINYLGAVASLIACVYPAGPSEGQSRIQLKAAWSTDDKQRPLLLLRVLVGADVDKDDVEQEANEIEKVGKRKRWIGGRDGIGHRISVEVKNTIA